MQFQKVGVVKVEQTFQNDDLRTLCFFHFIGAHILRKVVNGMINRFAVFELSHMLHKQIRVERIGMVVVDFHPFFKRNIAVGLVVRVHAEHNSVLSERTLDSACKRCFSASRAAANADDDTLHTHLTNTSLWLLARLSF